MLVGEPAGVELGLVLLLEDPLELVLEHPVIGLEDGVLGRQIHRIVLLQRITERRPREVLDRLLEVVHPHDHAAVLGNAHHLVHHRFAAVLWGEGQRDSAGTVHLEVGGAVLVAERMPADDDRLGPTGYQTRDVGDDDRRAEDCAAQDVSDGAVGRQPHLLEVELLDPGLVRSDGGALDADMVFEDGVRGVDGDLVIGGVAILHAEVVVLEVDVEVGQDQSFLDQLPDDARHLVAVEFYNRACDLDLGSTRHISPHPPTPGDRLVSTRVEPSRSTRRPHYMDTWSPSGRTPRHPPAAASAALKVLLGRITAVSLSGSG